MPSSSRSSSNSSSSITRKTRGFTLATSGIPTMPSTVAFIIRTRWRLCQSSMRASYWHGRPLLCTLRNDFLEFYSVYGLRAPAMFISDLRARCTTADRVRVRLLELVEKRGEEYLVGLLRKMLETAESGARQKIKSLPEGKFRAVVFNDAIGWTPALVRSCYLTLTKKGERLVFDFHGTSPENPSSYNVHSQAVVGHIANFFYEYLFHDLPICSTTFAPIDFVFPDGSILNPDKSAATSCCVFIGMQARCATHNAFARKCHLRERIVCRAARLHADEHAATRRGGLSQWKLAV